MKGSVRYSSTSSSSDDGTEVTSEDLLENLQEPTDTGDTTIQQQPAEVPVEPEPDDDDDDKLLAGTTPSDD